MVSWQCVWDHSEAFLQILFQNCSLAVCRILCYSLLYNFMYTQMTTPLLCSYSLPVVKYDLLSNISKVDYRFAERCSFPLVLNEDK
jgi:hypothetical protein